MLSQNQRQPLIFKNWFDIAITINNKAEKVIKPGKQGHTYIEASTFAKDYVFKAVPSGAGGRISFDYRIAQRDKIVP